MPIFILGWFNQLCNSAHTLSLTVVVALQNLPQVPNAELYSPLLGLAAVYRKVLVLPSKVAPLEITNES